MYFNIMSSVMLNTLQGGSIMAAKIFIRERHKVDKGEKKPRFRVCGVSDLDLTFYSLHMRKKELEQIAEATGAELVILKSEKKEKESAEKEAGS